MSILIVMFAANIVESVVETIEALIEKVRAFVFLKGNKYRYMWKV